jgi:hypothetical protein
MSQLRRDSKQVFHARDDADQGTEDREDAEVAENAMGSLGRKVVIHTSSEETIDEDMSSDRAVHYGEFPTY